MQLENQFLQFHLQPEQACWSLFSRRDGDPSLEHVRMRLSYRRGPTQYHTLDRWQPEAVDGPASVPSSQGPLMQVRLVNAVDSRGLRCTIDFALPQHEPFLLWRLGGENLGRDTLQIGRILLLDAGPTPERLASRAPASAVPASAVRHLGQNLAFFSNGWGSWNYTGVYGPKDSFRRTRLSFLTEPMRVNPGTPQPRLPGHFASDMFGVLGDRSRRVGFLAGFLSQLDHYGSLQAWTASQNPALQLWANGDGAHLSPGERFSTDWACLFIVDLDGADPLGPYLEAVARQYGLSSRLPFPEGASEIPTGWCSWYHYFKNVTAADIRENLQAAAKLRPNLPLEILQIDDGFETRVGDWYSFLPGFSQGVAPLGQEIREAGFTPGLWLAPFILDPRAQLAAVHPDWLLRGRFNRPVNAGYNSLGAFTTALDLTHPDALAYASEIIHTASHEWGFPYLKLDFLYAGALPGKHKDPALTRAQILRRGLEALRAAAGDETTLVGCGCPLGSAIGLVEAMRIGADVDPRWAPAYQNIEFFFQEEPDFPAARNAIQNSLTRAPLHRRWWVNDPDCLLLGADIPLTLAEIQSLASVIALTGGSIILSDDLPNLPPDRLRIAQTLLPPTGQRVQVRDWFDSVTPQHLRLDLENASGKWHLLALFNWDDQEQDLTLRLADYAGSSTAFDPNQDYLAREFWSGAVYPFQDGALSPGLLAPHGVKLFALRPASPGVPRYLGSDLHISQGMEVTAWDHRADELRLSLERPGEARGEVCLYLPNPPHAASLNGQALTWTAGLRGSYRFPVRFNQTGRLVVSFPAHG